VRLDAAATAPSHGGSIVADPRAYHWDFADGTTGFGVIAAHRYAAAGSYAVTLRAFDATGSSAAVAHTVAATDPAPGAGCASTAARARRQRATEQPATTRQPPDGRSLVRLRRSPPRRR